MEKINIGYAVTGSYCTFAKVLPQLKKLVALGYEVTPILSGNSYNTDTRFGKAEDFVQKIEEICGNKVLSTLVEVEPIGPKNLLDVLVIAPCTGNTLGKMANGISDTSVTLAAKAHLRNGKPMLIGVSSNDSLSNSARNIGQLLNMKNIYFVPMSQDDPIGKPASVVCDFEEIPAAVKAALQREQLQPVYQQ